jgi:hypothetical protein
MAIAITNLTNTTATAIITAASDIAVTDIIIFNTDSDAGSFFDWSLNLIPSGDSNSTDNLLYSSSLVTNGYANPLYPGSNIHVNTITGFIGNKWLLSTGDSFEVTLDDASNLSATWSGTPATVPVNIFVNYIGL